MSHEDVVRKVKKLLALARDTRGNEHQAAAAAEAAQRLLDENKLAMVDVDTNTATGRAEDREEQKIKAEKRMRYWRGVLLRAVADTTYTYALLHRGLPGYSLFGKPTDIQIAHELFDFLSEQIDNFAAVYQPFPVRVGSHSLRTLRTSFRNGCANRVSVRLREAFRARQVMVAAKHGESRALVLVNEGPLAQQFAERIYGKSKEKTYRFSMAGQAYGAGLVAGDRVRLQVERRLTHDPAQRLT